MIQNFLDDIYLIKNMSSKEFYNLNEDYKLLTPPEIFHYEVHKNIKKQKIKNLLCSIGIINTNDIKKNRVDKIIGISNNRTKTNILFKKEKKYQKKYNALDDLINEQNFSLYINEQECNIEIILYNLKTLEVLFTGKINNKDDDEDFIRPYNCSFVESVASIKDINSKLTLYPILGYYSNNNILMSDRDVLSHKAKSVWYQYFNSNNVFSRYAPIDDNIICDEEYDLILYHKLNKKIKKTFLNKKNKRDLFKKRFLISLKKEHYLDWSFKLNECFKKQIEPKINILKNRHPKNKKIEKKLFDLSNDFFHNSIF
jgi:hypothetical protein